MSQLIADRVWLITLLRESARDDYEKSLVEALAAAWGLMEAKMTRGQYKAIVDRIRRELANSAKGKTEHLERVAKAEDE